LFRIEDFYRRQRRKQRLELDLEPFAIFVSFCLRFF
jgi:hypothetical protein